MGAMDIWTPWGTSDNNGDTRGQRTWWTPDGGYCHLEARAYNCMATADRRLWCLSRNFDGIRDPDHSKTVQFTINPKVIYIFLIPVITEVETQLFLADLKCPMILKK